MKKSFSKRVVAVFLAVVMLVSSMPFVALGADAVYTKDVVNPTEWTLVASTDFSGLSSLGATAQGTIAGECPTTSDGGNPITWTAVDYNNNVQFNTDGMYLSDGYFYMSNYTTGTTPITGADEWKIELEFKFNSSWEFSTNGIFSGNTKTDRYAWLVMGTGTPFTKETNTVGSVNNVLGHDAQGPISSRGAYLSELKSTGYTFDLTENGGWLTTGVDYRYVVSYNKNYLKVHVEDMNGVIVANLCGAYAPDFHVDDLTNICFGDDNDSEYFQNTTYKSVKFYTGSTTPGVKNVDTDRTYYLFSYFTENSEDGEKIHMAVSDDGTNFEPLNGNKQMLFSDYVEANNTGSGHAATNNVRDPFCIPAADGKGYYFLGTDLDTQGGTNWANNSKLTVWYVDDLTKVDQAQPWSLDMQDWIPASAETGSVARAWAPEAVWDPEVGMYMLFWSNGYCNGGYAGKSGYTTMYYAYTKDFKSLETEPKVLYYSPYSNIDGNIMYDGELWYLVHKRESGDDATKIFVSTSEHASGPYIGTYQMYDSDNEKLEGCEIYQLTDGNYILMADSYSNPSRFAMYKGDSLDTIIRNNIVSAATTNINHCRPRHGYVVAITEEEYHDLIHTYGKAVFDSSVVHEGENVNEHLLARYFTTSDPTIDIVGGNTLINSGVSMVSNQAGRVAAYFAGNSTTGGSGDNSGASGTKTGSYAQVDTTNMFANINEKDGVTFSWYGYPTTSDSGRYFDWSTADAGTMVWDNGDYATNSYAYCSSAVEFGSGNNGSPVLAEGYESTSSYLNNWNLYTMTITNSYITFFINGQLLRTVYSKDLTSIETQGTPLEVWNMDASFFNVMKTANLYFGISSWGADATFQGYISDFRIYDKALSASDINDSLAQLSATPSTSVDMDARDFYDPMEHMDTDGDGTNDKTAYSATVSDPQTIHHLVLNSAGGVAAHNPAKTTDVADSNEGYTISMFYNPGATVGSEAIFNIGNGAGGTSVLELSEDGQFGFWNNSAGYIMARDVFGSESLPTNTWTHITLQIVPNGGHDLVNIFFDGVLVNTINTYTDTSNQNTLTNGESIVKYLQGDHSVYYGVSCGYIYGTGTCTNGYIDDFSIYSGVYSASSIFSNDSIAIADSLLGLAISDYKDKMATITTNGGFVYTNMGPTYQAYDEVLRYNYAVQYGQITLDAAHVVELYTNLQNELAEMEQYSKPATIQGLTQATTGLATSIGAQFTQNMLTSVNLATKYEGVNETDSQNDTNAAVFSGSFVWLYDGVNTPTAPILCGAYKNKDGTLNWVSSTRRLRNIYVSSGDIALGGAGLNTMGTDSYWHMTAGTTVDWYYNNSSSVVDYMHYLSSSQYATEDTYTIGSNETWYVGANYLTYTGTPSGYYTSFTPIYRFENNKDGDYQINSPGNIYILNYKIAQDAMMNANSIAILNDITSYSPDTAYELLAAYDALTAIDYTKDGTQTVALQSNENSVSSLATLVEEKVNNLLAQDPTLVKAKADYVTLGDTTNSMIEFLDRHETDTSTGLVYQLDENGYRTGEKYTLASWNALLDSYNDVVAHMASLNPFGADEFFVTDNAVINRLIGLLNASKNNLMAVADFEPVDSVTSVGSETYQAAFNDNGGSYADQEYTYYSWAPFETAYDAAEVLANADDTVRYNMPKYTVNFSNEGSYAYGRYLPIDINGDYVASSADAVCFVYIDTFYNYDAATGTYTESIDASGNYVLLDDGSYLNITSYRHGIQGVDWANLSTEQTNINNTGTNVTSTYNDLVPVAVDYSVYNSTVEDLLHQQDVAAFDQDYIKQASSVYGLVDINGSANGTETYDTGVTAANAKTINTDAYSSQVGTAYVVGSNGNTFKNANQTELDAQITAILSELTDANENTDGTKRTQYNVTFKVNVDGVETEIDVPVANYGESVTLDASSVVGDLTCNSWSVTTGSSTHRFVNYSNTYTINIQGEGDVTVVAYATAGATDTNPIEVSVLNQYNQKLHQVATTGETQVIFAVNSVKFITNGVESVVSVPVMPNYTISSWTVNDTELVNGTTYTLSDIAGSSTSVVFIPTVSKLDETTYSVTLDGVTVIEDAYDALVSVESTVDGAYAIAINENDTYSVVAYGTTYDVFINRNMDFVTIVKDANNNYFIGSTAGTQITDEVMINKLNGGLPFVYSAMSRTTGTNRYTTFSATSANCTVKVTEVGTVYSKVASTEDALVIGGANVFSKAATSPSTTTMQYSYTIPTSSVIYTRGYVKYTVEYTDANGNSATIQCIDYGNICTNSGLI